MTTRWMKGAALAWVLAVAAVGPAVAKAAPATLGQLVAWSQLILVGHVSQVSSDQANPVALVVVEDIWYGTAPGTLQVSLRRTWPCDISRAELGERAVLFLERDEAGTWRISHSGHGLMPVVGEQASVSPLVMMPAETRFRTESRAVPVDELRNMVIARVRKVRQ
jgi:hypothetical protein